LDEQAKNLEDEHVIARNAAISEKIKKEKSCAKKEKEFLVTSSAVAKPTIDEVKSFFLQQNFPDLEANKFFNYFSSVGWLVGGKTPMVNWQAAAQNWLLNASKFTDSIKISSRAQKLNTTTKKDYSEPL
jgi:hypothetical protein